MKFCWSNCVVWLPKRLKVNHNLISISNLPYTKTNSMCIIALKVKFEVINLFERHKGKLGYRVNLILQMDTRSMVYRSP